MKSPEYIAQKITEKIADSAFKVIQKKKFRKMAGFSGLSQTEQDRIFNELLVNGLSLAILIFRTVKERSSGEKRSYFNELQMEMASAYPNWLKELGTDVKFVEKWKGLIKMRCDEYEKDFKEYKKELPDPQKANPWVHIVSIGCHHHIRRGKTDEKDPMFKFVIEWISGLSEMISKNAI